MIVAVLARTVRCNKTRARGERGGGVEQAITTHLATQWAKGVQKWRKPAIYPPKPTVAWSVSACFAVQRKGAGEHDGLLAYPVEDHQWASLS